MSNRCHPERSEGSLRARAERFFASLRMTAFLALLALSACASPEAHRTRGGGPGADIRNWGQPVEIHAGAQPYHDTSCATEVECQGPLPVFGPTPPPD
jgi:hypothetical protein